MGGRGRVGTRVERGMWGGEMEGVGEMGGEAERRIK